MTVFQIPTVRPEFTGTLAIKAGRHPILGIIKTAGALVPNDTYCCDSSSFQLIRGPKLSTTLVLLPHYPGILLFCYLMPRVSMQHVRYVVYANLYDNEENNQSHNPGAGHQRV